MIIRALASKHCPVHLSGRIKDATDGRAKHDLIEVSLCVPPEVRLCPCLSVFHFILRQMDRTSLYHSLIIRPRKTLCILVAVVVFRDAQLEYKVNDATFLESLSGTFLFLSALSLPSPDQRYIIFFFFFYKI